MIDSCDIRCMNEASLPIGERGDVTCGNPGRLFFCSRSGGKGNPLRDNCVSVYDSSGLGRRGGAGPIMGAVRSGGESISRGK